MKDRVIHGPGDPMFDVAAQSLIGEKKPLEGIDMNTDQFLDLTEDQMRDLSQDELEIVSKLWDVDIDARTREVQSIVDYTAELLTKSTAVMSSLDIAKLRDAVALYEKTHAVQPVAPVPKTEARKVTAAQLTQRINTNDNLMNPIIWGNLIDTVNANEPEVSEASVMKVFRDLLSHNANEARAALSQNMARVIELAQHE